MGQRGYFIYNDTEVRTGGFGGLGNIRANPQYVRHYGNYLELTFMLRATTSAGEKLQIGKELEICERKLEYWGKKHDFVFAEALPEIMKLKRNWEVVDVPDRWSKG
jgi:hypothetical protein